MPRKVRISAVGRYRLRPMSFTMPVIGSVKTRENELAAPRRRFAVSMSIGP